MGVYVDNPQWNLGRMVMCHMLADTTNELLSMADAIEVRRKWVQYVGFPNEHLDICKSKRELAVELGAKEVTSRDLAIIVRRKKIEAGSRKGR